MTGTAMKIGATSMSHVLRSYGAIPDQASRMAKHHAEA
jgi:hypothetical protein